jgi:hypothetical protein
MAISLKCPTSHPPLNESTAPPPDERPVGSTDGAFFVSGVEAISGAMTDTGPGTSALRLRAAEGPRPSPRAQRTTYAANAAAIAQGR